MKRLGIIIALVLILTSGSLLLGCTPIRVITDLGPVVSRDFDLADFTQVQVSHGFEIELIPSETFSVYITANENIFPHLDVSKSGNTLNIGVKENTITIGDSTIEARVTMPDLYIINLSGGSRANITGFSLSHDFSAVLSGGSRITGNITAGDTNFDLSGGSRANIEGTADDLIVSGSGGSRLDLEAFSVDNADVHLSGGGSATVNINGTLNVDLSGGSKVIYIGQPTMGDIDLSGGSRVDRK